jgi:hypothetical protein
MKSNFDACLKLVLKHEGGFINHPIDPGGMTCLGVTKKVWEDYTGEIVTEADMRALTAETVAPLYQDQYWKKAACEALPAGLDYAVFDYAVNSGPMKAVKTLQAILDVNTDGIIGPMSLAEIEKRDPANLVARLCNERVRFLQNLPTWQTFGKGWGRRIKEVEYKATAMCQPASHAS